MNTSTPLPKKQSTTPRLCFVEASYIKYMHNIDYRISVKYNNRPFVVLTIPINEYLYAIPLTSTTNAMRKAQGKKPRANIVTTKIMDGDTEIADLLYNNMFPVTEDLITDIMIDPIVDTYLSNEERYLRKHWEKINFKAVAVYQARTNQSHRNHTFLEAVCCDFKKLESSLLQYIS